MSNKAVSVIVPVYNIAKYLPKCLDSLLAQSYRPLEIIAVNDGSTDESGNILNDYSIKHPEIIVIHQENKGVSEARNAGINAAKGDYIGFADGDDYVEPNMFSVLVDAIETHNVDIAHCGYQMVFPGRIDYYYNTGETLLLNNESGIKEILTGEKFEPGLCNKLYKRELFEDIRLPPNIRINEDLLVNYWLFKKAENSFYMDLPLYHYMIRKGSAATGAIKTYKLWDPITVIKTIMQDVEHNTDLFIIAYNRYIRNLISIADGRHGLSDSAVKARELLIGEQKSGRLAQNAKKKTIYMAIGVSRFNGLYIMVRRLYEKITKVNHKYDVK